VLFVIACACACACVCLGTLLIPILSGRCENLCSASSDATSAFVRAVCLSVLRCCLNRCLMCCTAVLRCIIFGAGFCGAALLLRLTGRTCSGLSWHNQPHVTSVAFDYSGTRLLANYSGMVLCLYDGSLVCESTTAYSDVWM